MSSDGFENEDKLILAINGKRRKELNPNLGVFLDFCCGVAVPENAMIRCHKKAGTNKSDIIIEVGGIKKFGVSVKKGGGNSVHQEPVEPFVDYLKEDFGMGDDVGDDIKFFVWGDGTLDGSGPVENRMSAPQLMKKYPEKIKRISKFFKKHKKELLERFVIKGVVSKSSPEFIYYGDENDGMWMRSTSALKWLCKEENESTGAIPVGRLTFQAWNRNINGGSSSEIKRGVIQLKWGTIGDDISQIQKGD